MAAEIRTLRFTVTIPGSDHLPDDLYPDDVYGELHRVMKAAGLAYIEQHPELFVVPDID